MNVKGFIKDLREHSDNMGYHLYFGTKQKYNTKRIIENKEIILEPFVMHPYRERNCKYSTNLTFWVGIRREIDAKFMDNADGDLTDFMQYMIEEATYYLYSLNELESVLVKQKLQTIPLTYYEADSNQSVNTQSFIRFTIPVDIYLFNTVD